MAGVELLQRYAEVLLAQSPWWIAAALAAFGLGRWLDRAGSTPPPRAAVVAIALLLGGGALAWALHLAWVCDDAFITFRFSDNLARGRGATWNPGERVEGYTNFLWMLALAGVRRLQLAPAPASLVLGLLSWGAALWGTARMHTALSPTPARIAGALAVTCLGFNYLFASFATSGLETMAAAAATLWSIERAERGRTLSAGGLGITAVLLHPDHAIFYVGLGVILLARRTSLRQLARYAAPFAVVYAPYFLLRWQYYGLPLPNTFYAKSGGGLHLGQGSYYVAASIVGGGLLFVLPLAVRGALAHRERVAARMWLWVLPIYLAYVVKIGGDYMWGRLLVTCVPLTYVFAALALPRLEPTRWRRLGMWGLLASMVPTPIVTPRKVEHGLADERTHTPVAQWVPTVIDSRMFRRARLFQRAFATLERPPILADIEIGMLGYFNDLTVIDLHGLTDAAVAAQPLHDRGRPGHEKFATAEYLLRRGVHLARGNLHGPGWQWATEIQLEGLGRYFIVRWHPEAMAALAATGRARFQEAGASLDRYLAEADQRDRAQVVRDFETFFTPFYFDQVDDPTRRARFAALMGRP